MGFIKEHTFNKTAIFVVYIMIAATFIPAIYAGFTSKSDVRTSDNVVHLDFRFQEDSASSYDLISSTHSRVLWFNNKLDTNGKGYEIANSGHYIRIKDTEFKSEKNNQKSFGSDKSFFGKFSDTTTKSDTNNNQLIYSNNELFDVVYDSTISGIKEVIILKSQPNNITDDMILSSEIEIDPTIELLYLMDSSSMKYKNSILTENTDQDIILADKRTKTTIFTIPSPMMWDSPEHIQTDEKIIHIKDSIDFHDLEHRISRENGNLFHEIIIPSEIFKGNVQYPLYIDPSITTFSGYAEYEGLNNGSIMYRDGTGSETILQSTRQQIYLESNLTIASDETLRFINVDLKVNNTGTKIRVEKGGRLDIVDDSVVTTSSNCNGYHIEYSPGSHGSVIGSTIEKINSSKGFTIGSSEIQIDDCNFQYNSPVGLFINQSSPSIKNTTGCCKLQDRK